MTDLAMQVLEAGGWRAPKVWVGVARRLRSVSAVVPVEMSDSELISRAGEELCLRELIARHERSMRRLALSMLRNRADADEAVQDAFVVVYRKGATFRGESSARTWLHSICYRKCLDRLRRKRFDIVHIDQASQSSLTAVEVDHSFTATLETALDDLPPQNREAFVLVDVLGFTREDAAELVGVPGNTMRARVARARLLLADALDDGEVPA